MGALPARAKYSTLSSYVTRRLRNTCDELRYMDKAEKGSMSLIRIWSVIVGEVGLELNIRTEEF